MGITTMADKPYCEEHAKIVENTTETRIAVQKILTALAINGSGNSGHLEEIFQRLRSLELKLASLPFISGLVGVIVGAMIVRYLGLK